MFCSARGTLYPMKKRVLFGATLCGLGMWLALLTCVWALAHQAAPNGQYSEAGR